MMKPWVSTLALFFEAGIDRPRQKQAASRASRQGLEKNLLVEKESVNMADRPVAMFFFLRRSETMSRDEFHCECTVSEGRLQILGPAEKKTLLVKKHVCFSIQKPSHYPKR